MRRATAVPIEDSPSPWLLGLTVAMSWLGLVVHNYLESVDGLEPEYIIQSTFEIAIILSIIRRFLCLHAGIP